MDNRLRILLRRYAATQNPEDAELVAKALLRSTDISEIQIWVFEEETKDWWSNELFCDEKDALIYAVDWVQQYLNNDNFNTDDPSDANISGLMTDLVTKLEIESNNDNFESAHSILDQLNLLCNQVDWNISVNAKKIH